MIVKTNTTVCSIGFISGRKENVIPLTEIPYILRSCIFLFMFTISKYFFYTTRSEIAPNYDSKKTGY